MRGLIIEVSPVSKNTSIAHVRNSLYIQKQTGFDICWNDSTIIKSIKKQYDILLFSYSSKFAPHQLMEKLIHKNKNAKLMWAINEYNGSVPKCLRDAGGINVIANFDRIKKRNYDYVKKWLNVDLNSWIIQSEKQTLTNKKYDSVYYGTYREGRKNYFKKYLQNGIHCSSSSKNHKFFRNAGCEPIFIEKLKWTKHKENLSLFDKSLYIEDLFTHKHFNRMSNRFYEALFCNVLPVFDESCVNTIKKSNFNINDDWIVNSLEDMKKLNSKDYTKEIKNLFYESLEIKKNETLKTLDFIYNG